MKIKIALIFATLILLQACGSKGRMMHSEVSTTANLEIAMVAINE